MILLDVSDASRGDLIAVVVVFLFALVGACTTFYWIVTALARWVAKTKK